MSLPAYIAAVEERLEHYRAIREAITAEFIIDGDGRFVVRRHVVVQSVADALSKPWRKVNVTARLSQDVREVATMDGAHAFRRGNRRLFRGVRLRSLSAKEAEEQSRELMRRARG